MSRIAYYVMSKSIYNLHVQKKIIKKYLHQEKFLECIIIHKIRNLLIATEEVIKKCLYQEKMFLEEEHVMS